MAKKSTAAGLDGWAWNEIKALSLSWFVGLALVLRQIEAAGKWPQGLLDAKIAMIPKAEGDSTPLGQRPLCVLPVVYRLRASVRLAHLKEWFSSWVPDCVFSAGKGVSSVDAWYATSIDIEEVLCHARHSDFHVFVADVVKSFDTVDRDILDCALGRLGLPAWFRRVYFSFHRDVRVRFKLAAGLGVALYTPWCRYLESRVDISPQLYADNLKCSSCSVDSVLAAARYTVSYVHAVGQEASPSKYVLLSTSKAARRRMTSWRNRNEGCFWAVKLDVRDLGGHLDVTLRAVAGTLSNRVRIATTQVPAVGALLTVRCSPSRRCSKSCLRECLRWGRFWGALYTGTGPWLRRRPGARLLRCLAAPSFVTWRDAHMSSIVCTTTTFMAIREHRVTRRSFNFPNISFLLF